MTSERELIARTRQRLRDLLRPESDFLWVIIIYGIAISLLTLAVPVAVQFLINTIVNIGSFRAVAVLSLTLLLILMASGALSALRLWAVELYERRIFARLTGEISYRVALASSDYFEGHKKGSSNRYFEILLLQKNIPFIMLDGFAFVLQAVVGFTLVSFYHPWLFAFNVVIGVAIYAIWKVWSTGAKASAIQHSKQKYLTAHWLEGLENEPGESLTQDRVAELAAGTDAHVNNFIGSQRAHFSFTYPQSLMFLALYAFGSSGLLGLGGWLVIQGVLSVGQLVAAELVMASIFLGLSRFSTYLKAYYELYGAADKLGDLLSLPVMESNADISAEGPAESDAAEERSR